MQILFPWGRGIGTLGFKFKSGFYFDIFNLFHWYELKRLNPGIFILNPNRNSRSWSCKYCKDRIACMTRSYCARPRTWIYPLERFVNVRS